MRSDLHSSTVLIGDECLLRDGIRLILANTPFSPQCCLGFADDLEFIDPRGSMIFIIIAAGNDDVAGKMQSIKERHPFSRMVLLATDSRPDWLVAALETRASAMLLTTISPEGLIKTLHALACNEITIFDSKLWPFDFPCAPGALRQLEHSDMRPSPFGKHLSARETEIVQRITIGDSNKHIARHLDIAEATVKAHVKAILSKIGVNNRTQLAMWAASTRLFDTKEVDGVSADPGPSVAESPEGEALPSRQIISYSQPLRRRTSR